MKNPEEAIDKVLAGLRDGEPANGMESRILQTVQIRAARRTAPAWRSLLPHWMAALPPASAALSLSCAVGLAILLGVAVFTHHPLQIPAHSMNSSRAVSSAALAAPTAESPMLRPRETSARPKVTMASLEGNRRDNKARSRQSVKAASHPAPPLPLTRQEQLLLHVVRQVDPKQLAMLNPRLQAMRNAKEKDEFQKFFGLTTMIGDQ